MATNNSIDDPDMVNKGDLVAGQGGGSRPAIRSVGTNGQFLTADSAQATGLNWTTNTNPALSSAFFAFLNAAVTNVTGDSTPYTVICESTNYNLGTNYSTVTGLYTAPQDGFYQFNASVNMSNVNAAHNEAQLEFITNSGLMIHGETGNPAAERSSGLLNYVGSMSLFLSAGQTIGMLINVHGSTKTVGVAGFSTFFPTILPTHFSGFLVT